LEYFLVPSILYVMIFNFICYDIHEQKEMY
jgi:hypothetical protein